MESVTAICAMNNFIFAIILIIYSLENNRSVKIDYITNNRGHVDYVKIPSIARWISLRVGLFDLRHQLQSQ